MKLNMLSGRRGAAILCILLSACAAGPLGTASGDTAKPDPAFGAYLAARYADNTGNLAMAARYYGIALQTGPDNKALVTQGFMADVLSGKAGAAALARQLPQNPLATMLLGNHAAQAGDFAKAGRRFARLPSGDLTGLIKPLLLAWAQFGQDNEPAALRELVPLFDEKDFGAIYVLNAALIADAAGDTSNAARFYGAINASQPNLRLAEILASWDTRQGQNGRAMAVLSALVKTHPDLAIALPVLERRLDKPVISTPTGGMAEAYLTLAGALTQPRAAMLRTAFLRFALTLRPDLTAARLLLADTQTSASAPHVAATPVQMRNALATLAPVTKSDPLYAPAAVQRANLLTALNRTHEAAALLRGLLAKDPKNPDLLANLAETLRAGGQFAAAIPYYTKALAVLGKNKPPSAWSLYFDRGICEYKTGHWDQAEPDMKAALRLSPKQPYVLNYLAYSWAVHGEKLKQARTMLTQAVALDPHDGAVIDSLGYVEMKLGHAGKAVTMLTKAVQLSPDDAEVNGHLGDAFWRDGQALQAAYQWQRALSLHPKPKLAAALHAKIRAHFGAAP